MAPRKKKDFTDISSGLKGVFLHKNMPLLWQTYKLVREWPFIVGKTVAKKSEPAYILNNTLWVYVDSSVLMQHMQHQKLDLLERINSFLPEAEIQDIRWAMKPTQPVERRSKIAQQKKSRPTAEEEKAFTAMASTVEDDNCREALEKLWQAFHTRQ